MTSRAIILDVARGSLGAVQGDAKHKLLINTYNSYVTANKGKAHKGSTYKVKFSDAWCATAVSAWAIMCHAYDIIPTECSCTRMINLFKEMGCFESNDNYIPKPADIIFYRWDINGKDIPSEAYDVDGISHHVGIVEECDGNFITVIEGNRDNKCQRRKIKVGWKYIHGFGLPKYSGDASISAQEPDPEPLGKEVIHVVQKGENMTKIAKKYNTTVNEIKRLNPQIKNINLIYVNQEIRVK